MPIFQVMTSNSLPSGEVADFGFWMTATTIELAVAAVDAWYVTLAGDAAWKALFQSGTIFGEAKVSEIFADTGAVITTAMAGTSYNGSGGGDSLPPQVALCVTVNTAIISRTTRGRFYLPPLLASNTTASGRVYPAAQATAVGSLAAAFTVLNGTDGTLIVWSRKLHEATDATSLSVGDVYDTMRTRRDKLVEVRSTLPV